MNNEIDVRNQYVRHFEDYFKCKIVSPHNSDGILITRDVSTLFEFKFDEDLKDRKTYSSILIQALYYLKKIENKGKIIPKSIFIGDKNSCFILPTNIFEKYLQDKDIDWTIPPSKAAKNNSKLLNEIINDQNISPYVQDINIKRLNINTIAFNIEDICKNNPIKKVKVNNHNMNVAFDYFDEYVLDTNKSLNINDRINLFFQCITDSINNFINPKDSNYLVNNLNFKKVKLKNTAKSFFEYYECENYTDSEKSELLSQQDRLIEDITRISKGEFYTPTVFADLAIEYLDKELGDNWRDEYVVWDCCCGTGNLTRDYKFKELYLSTIEGSDIESIEQAGYNPEAVKFQYDFLNDGIKPNLKIDILNDSKLPNGLKEVFKQKKKLLFLINPPYGANIGGIIDKNKNTTINNISKKMKLEGLNNSKNLYIQFLYRILIYNKVIPDILIGFFIPGLLYTGKQLSNFRKIFLSKFNYENGFLFPANEFSRDSNIDWGVTFAIFKSIDSKNNIKTNFNFDIIDDNYNNIGIKLIYNLDSGNNSLKDWLGKDPKNSTYIDCPKLSTALKVVETDKGQNIIKDSYGFFVNQNNTVYQNHNFIFLLSSGLSNKGSDGISITDENLFRCTTAFMARRLIKRTYIYDVDQYLPPNENHNEFEQFKYDSIVYSLFNNKSFQSSLRNVEYKGKKWNIKNHFFWLPKEYLIQFANEVEFKELIVDTRDEKERMMTNLIYGEKDYLYDKFSNDAKEILNTANYLLKESMEDRKLMNITNPEYHLNSWDAGYTQLKLVWKNDKFKKDFKEFRELYDNFEDRLRPLVYELGFLK